VLLDTIADAAAAAGVAAAGAVIYASHGLFWLDPAVALTIALVVGYHATRLLFQIRTALTR
jgi:cobalt-zinc-cadmium efflux system protein